MATVCGRCWNDGKRQDNGVGAQMVRPAVTGDATSLAALSIEVWLNTYIRNGVNAFFADYALAQYTGAYFGEVLSNSAERILVSDNAQGIDGFVRVTTGAAAPAPGCSDVTIATLYVQPRHQGSGVGKRLLEAGLACCAATGRPDAWLTVNAENERAIRFYLNHGFQQVGDTHFHIGDQAYPNHVMRFVFGAS